MASDTKMSKPKGLKDHKKAQREKAIAKRAAAAAGQAESKKGSKVEKKVEVTAVQKPMENDSNTSPLADTAAVNEDVSMVAEKIDEDVFEKIAVPTITVEALSSTDTISQDTEGAASVTIAQDELVAKAATAAHHKKLEADLYDNMESAQECFARLRHAVSATVEYHYDVVHVDGNDTVFDSSLADADESQGAADDTGVKYGAVQDAAAYTPENASADGVIAGVADVCSVEPETTNRAITLAQLFSSTSDTGASMICATRPKASLTLAEVEKMQAEAKAASEASKSSSLDINQLFAADKAERSIIVRMPKAVAASTVPETTQLFAAEGAPIVRLPAARNWACVLAGMTFTCMDEIAEDESPVKPVIIGGRSGTPVDRKLVEAVVLGRPEGRVDVSEVPSPILEGNANDKPVPDVLQLGSEKLMSMLGVDCRVTTPAPTQQNDQEGANKIMALLGYPRSRTVSGSTAPNPPQFSPVMNGRRSTPNTDVTGTPPLLDDVLAKPNTHNFSKNDYGFWKIPNMGPSSGPYSYRQPGSGYQYPASHYVAEPCFPGYHPHGLFITPFYGQWDQHSQGYACW